MIIDWLRISWELFWSIWLLFIILSFIETEDKRMFLLLAIWSLFYWFHFYWIWLFTASLINFVDVSKNLAVIKFKNNIYAFLIFAIFYWIIWLLTWNWDPLNYLFTLCSITSLSAAFFMEWISLRIVYLLVTIYYLYYTIVWYSISWSITNVLLIFSIISSIYMLHRRRWFFWKLRYYSWILTKKIRPKSKFYFLK